jgi:hypothetical protein
METVKDYKQTYTAGNGSQGQETGARKSVRELVGLLTTAVTIYLKYRHPKCIY